MRVCHTIQPVFDDPNLVAFGGLPAVMRLAELECRMFFGLVICWFLRLRNGFGTIPVRLHSGSGIPTPSGAVSDCNAVRSIEQYL